MSSDPLSKLPAMRGTGTVRRLPTPADYRELKPLFPMAEPAPQNRLSRRKRLIIWFGVAVALHVALLLAIFLTPKLRLRWEPSPDDWVPVTSVAVAPAPVAAPAGGARADRARPPDAAPPKRPGGPR